MRLEFDDGSRIMGLSDRTAVSGGGGEGTGRGASHSNKWEDSRPVTSSRDSTIPIETFYEIEATCRTILHKLNLVNISNHVNNKGEASSLLLTTASTASDFSCRVALQFPNDLLYDAPQVCCEMEHCLFNAIQVFNNSCDMGNAQQQQQLQPLVFVIGDTTYGSNGCCIDEVAALHLNANIIIHYGPTCLVPTSSDNGNDNDAPVSEHDNVCRISGSNSCNSIPVLYVLGRKYINVTHCAKSIIMELMKSDHSNTNNNSNKESWNTTGNGIYNILEEDMTKKKKKKLDKQNGNHNVNSIKILLLYDVAYYYAIELLHNAIIQQAAAANMDDDDDNYKINIVVGRLPIAVAAAAVAAADDVITSSSSSSNSNACNDNNKNEYNNNAFTDLSSPTSDNCTIKEMQLCDSNHNVVNSNDKYNDILTNESGIGGECVPKCCQQQQQQQQHQQEEYEKLHEHAHINTTESSPNINKDTCMSGECIPPITIGGLVLPSDVLPRGSDLSAYTLVYIGGDNRDDNGDVNDERHCSQQLINILMRCSGSSGTHACWVYTPASSSSCDQRKIDVDLDDHNVQHPKVLSNRGDTGLNNECICNNEIERGMFGILNTDAASMCRRELNRRYYLTQKARMASIFGIVVGTLGISHFRDVITRLQLGIEECGKASYVIAVGKINVAKLANFAEVECFVLVSCPNNRTLLDSRDFPVPVITPFELAIALGWREWDGFYSNELTDFLSESWHAPSNEEDLRRESGDGSDNADDDEPYYSMISGRYESSDRDVKNSSCQHEGGATDLKKFPGKGQLTSYRSEAAEFFKNREYQGLKADTGHSVISAAKIGQAGIASDYGNR